MTNGECGRKGVPLKLITDKDGVMFHVQPNGKKKKVTIVTDEQYFNKRKCGKGMQSRGSSWMFDHHLAYNGWLWFNSLVEVEVEELPEAWS
jgi:hypothetical protein